MTSDLGGIQVAAEPQTRADGREVHTTMLLTVIWFILIGAVIGLLARLVVPGRNSIGTLMTILVGVVGAVLGGVIAGAVGAGTLVAFIFAVVIAAVLVAMLSGGGRRRHRVF